MKQKSVLIFGGGVLQESIINVCNSMGLFTIVIDPNPNAFCSKFASLFVSFSNNEYEVARDLVIKYNVSAFVTAATDKPLVVMAKIAQEFNLCLFSEETAILCTDKFLMKQRFSENKIPHAIGFDINSPDQVCIDYPIILKPRDNSGSRGVVLCESKNQLNDFFKETIRYTKKSSILVEEYIEGKEYSIEALHTESRTHIIQITEKKTTLFPYNVELGHIQPANIEYSIKQEIYEIIRKIAKAFDFRYCASHTELKISHKGITVIETSPRLGGDYITSKLTQLSTGVDVEESLMQICLGDFKEKILLPEKNVSGIEYFVLNPGLIQNIGDLSAITKIKGVKYFNFSLNVGDQIPIIKSSLDRYGFVIIQAENISDYIKILDNVGKIVSDKVTYFNYKILNNA